MATVLTLPITTSPLPKSYIPPAASSSSRLSRPHPAGHRTLLPVGPAHLNYLRLALHHNHDFVALDAHLEAERQAKEKLLAAGSAGSEDDLGVGDEEETAELLALDPKEWKVTNFPDLYQGFERRGLLAETRSLRSPRPLKIQISSFPRPDQDRPYVSPTISFYYYCSIRDNPQTAKRSSNTTPTKKLLAQAHPPPTRQLPCSASTPTKTQTTTLSSNASKKPTRCSPTLRNGVSLTLSTPRSWKKRKRRRGSPLPSSRCAFAILHHFYVRYGPPVPKKK